MWALFWMAFGAVILLANYGVLDISFRFSRDWPVLLIAFGLLKLLDGLFPRSKQARAFWAWRPRDSGRWEKTGCPPCGKSGDSVKTTLDDLEKGNISAEEALKKMGE
jgi:hypothetical protein